MTVQKNRILHDKAKNTGIYRKYRTAGRTAICEMSRWIDLSYPIDHSVFELDYPHRQLQYDRAQSLVCFFYELHCEIGRLVERYEIGYHK